MADGLWGANTRTAIAKWQTANKVTATGYVTSVQVRLIASQAGTTADCHADQQGSSARLVTGETCEDLAAATAVLRPQPDVRTASSALAHTAAAPVFVIRATSRASSAYEPHAKPALQDCPRDIALRI